MATSQGWACITQNEWQASWLDNAGIPAFERDDISAGSSLTDGVLSHFSDLLYKDFPKDAPLYIATPECLLAPESYIGEASKLIHTVLDETIPDASVQTVGLPKPDESCLVFSCPPALMALWQSVAPKGKVIPLVERDVNLLFNQTTSPDCALLHVLPGYIQVSIKASGQFLLCNAFRYQESEEASLMVKAVIQQFFQHADPEVIVLYVGGTEKDIAISLAKSLGANAPVIPESSYWLE
mgnify:CR=1 FL=1